MESFLGRHIPRVPKHLRIQSQKTSFKLECHLSEEFPWFHPSAWQSISLPYNLDRCREISWVNVKQQKRFLWNNLQVLQQGHGPHNSTGKKKGRNGNENNEHLANPNPVLGAGDPVAGSKYCVTPSNVEPRRRRQSKKSDRAIKCCRILCSSFARGCSDSPWWEDKHQEGLSKTKMSCRWASTHAQELTS